MFGPDLARAWIVGYDSPTVRQITVGRRLAIPLRFTTCKLNTCRSYRRLPRSRRAVVRALLGFWASDRVQDAVLRKARRGDLSCL